MSNKGYIVSKKGKGQVLKDGSLAVFNADGYCQDCCGKPKTIATWTASDYATWDLTPYQGDDIGPPGGYWRLTNTYMSYVPERKGCIDANGKLVGLPSSTSTTTYKYTWWFVLEVGCRTKDGKIKWADGTTTAAFNC
jgi:hypothetical protein